MRTSSRTPEAGSPRLVRLWSLREDVLVETAPEGGDVLLHGRWGTERVKEPDQVTGEALRRMCLGPVSLENVLSDAEHGAAERITGLLDRLQHLVVRSLALEGGEHPLLSIVPMSPHAALDPRVPVPDRPVRLSRFAALHSDGDGFTLESPLSLHRVLLEDSDSVALVGALGWASSPEEIAAASALPRTVVLEIIALLVAAELAVTGEPPLADSGPGFAEDSDPALATWSPVDLLFHTRSTTGRHDNDFGATYPILGRLDPEPAVKQTPDGPRFPLPRPTLRQVLAVDPPFTVVLENCRSRCRFDPDGTALTVNQLGELLYRAMRVRSIGSVPVGPVEYQVSDRPYPSVGGSHPLEVYLTVDHCTGLPRGAYHYDPVRHSLTMVNKGEEELDELLTVARQAAGTPTACPVLITLAARFPRTAWKFSGLGYSLVLQEAGTAVQTLCLAGTAMGLATAALGTADIDVGARAAGTDWRVESAVGQLIVGPRGRQLPGEAAPAPGGAPQFRSLDDPDWAEASVEWPV